MPIVVKDYTWDQSDKMVYITVPLKGVVPNKMDILSTEAYLKVNYPPFLFECFLYAPVNDLQSATEVGNGIAIFKLEKVEADTWPSLQCPNADDKAIQRELRDAALKRYQERGEELKKQVSEIRTETGRYAVREQMKLEQEDRARIEKIKEREQTIAMEELDKWKEQQRQLVEQEKRLAVVRRKQERCAENPVVTRPAVENTKPPERFVIRDRKPNIFQEVAGDAPMREAGKISISFTPRVFPTPTRESLAPEEEAWLAKQAEARRIIDADNVDLSEEERNPVWLRDKGNSFFQAGDYQAALNAYSHAIRLNCKMHSVYSNRAACHLKMNNCFRCVEDCSKALDLLTPPVPQNAGSRAKVHVRRGTAYCRLELYAEGLMDYEAALKLEPTNEGLRADAENIRRIIQSSTGES